MHRAMTGGGIGAEYETQRTSQQQRSMLQEKEEREKVGAERRGHFLVEAPELEKISSSSDKDLAVIRMNE